MKASLFVTCIVNQFFPQVGESTVRVLDRLGVEIDFPPNQTCCGQPAFNSGFWEEAKPLARKFLDEFESEKPIVIPSGSCASMIKIFYAELLKDEPDLSEKIRTTSNRVYELTEFIVDYIGISDLLPYTRSTAKNAAFTVTYHEGCHLRRELGATTQARILLRSLRSLDLVEMEQAEVCCGFGGTFSVKYPEISAAMMADKITAISKTNSGTLTACDSSCLMQIKGGLEKTSREVNVLHIAEILDQEIT